MSVALSVLLPVGLFLVLGMAWRGRGRAACSADAKDAESPACNACPIAPQPLEEAASPKIDWWAQHERHH